MRSLAAAVLGLAAGLAWNAFRSAPADPTPIAKNQRVPSSRSTTPPRGTAGLVNHAANLTRAEWPAFFRSQLDSPESSRLAARLWAEADPDGFWKWLREERDPYLIDRFALDLLRVWAESDPDAAMNAALQVTRQSIGETFRQTVVDTVLGNDLEKGLQLAARAGSLRSYKPSACPWITRDPAAATLGLAALPAKSIYRLHLPDAITAWFNQEPAAAFEWLKSNHSTLTAGVATTAFTAAAKFNPTATVEAALAIADPDQRILALSGVISAATLDPATATTLLGELPLSMRAKTASQMILERPAKSLADLHTSAALLEPLPPNRDTLSGVSALASQWGKTSPATALEWAATLPDAASRRTAYSSLAWSLPPEQLQAIGSLPLTDLSDELFRNISTRLHDRETRETWLRQLPPMHAAWARSIRP